MKVLLRLHFLKGSFSPFIYCFYEELHYVYGLLTSMHIRLMQFFLDFDLNLLHAISFGQN